MSVAFLAFALMQQSDLQREAPVLLRQASERVIEASAETYYVIGNCAAIYPAGVANPYVQQTQARIAGLGIPELVHQVQHANGVMHAQGLADERPAGLTVSKCAEVVQDANNDLDQRVTGLEGLITALERDRRR